MHAALVAGLRTARLGTVTAGGRGTADQSQGQDADLLPLPQPGDIPGELDRRRHTRARPGPGPARSEACSWEPARNRGTCSFDPAKEFVISLVWPTPGTWSLTVAPVRDSHDRVFTPAPTATRLEVNVVP